MLDKQEMKPILEALIFAADSAISVDRIANILEGTDRAAIKEALEELVQEYAELGRGFTIEEVAGGYQYRTNPDYAPWLRRLFKIGLQRISKAAMEALAIVAYKQPVTRGEVEAIRGVDSGGVLATLLDKRFIKIVGRKEVPGRPVVYGTTKDFLETFDLKDLSCLPSLKDIQRMEEENGAQDAFPEEQGTAQNGEAGQEYTGAGSGGAESTETGTEGPAGSPVEGLGGEGPYDGPEDLGEEDFGAEDGGPEEADGEQAEGALEEMDSGAGEDRDAGPYGKPEGLGEEDFGAEDGGPEEADGEQAEGALEEMDGGAGEDRDAGPYGKPEGLGEEDFGEEDGDPEEADGEQAEGALEEMDSGAGEDRDAGPQPEGFGEEDSGAEDGGPEKVDGDQAEGAPEEGDQTGSTEAPEADDTGAEETGSESRAGRSAEASEDNSDGGDSVPEKG